VRISLYPIPSFACWRLGLMWVAHWRYEDMPWRVWVFTTAHDSSSFYWRILGLEINWMRE
jgi:hypothetical protein